MQLSSLRDEKWATSSVVALRLHEPNCDSDPTPDPIPIDIPPIVPPERR